MQFYASPEEETRAIRRAVARVSGCVVRELGVVAKSRRGGPDVVGSVACLDGWGAGRLLLELAEEDARTPGARALALRLRRRFPSDLRFARAVHAFVHDRVRFAHEKGEIFQSGAYTLTHRIGDCDDHFRAVYGIAVAGGLSSRLGLLHHGNGDGPAHAAALLCPRDSEAACDWAETTIAARYGENPNAAARRLGVTSERSDIAKEIVIMAPSDPPEPFDAHADAFFDEGDDAAIGDVTAPKVTALTSYLPDEYFQGVKALADYFVSRGATITADDLNAVFFVESRGIHANVANALSGCAGLNQICNLAGVGWKGTHAEYLALSEVEQLQWVRRYFDNVGKYPKIRNLSHLYTVQIAPASTGAADSTVLYRAPSKEYVQNAGIEPPGVPKTGTITIAMLAPFVLRNAQGAKWEEVKARQAAAGGGGRSAEPSSGGAVAGLVVLALAAAGGVAAWWYA